MNTGSRVTMKKRLDRIGIREGAGGTVKSVDRWGRVMVTFDEFFGLEKPLGNGYLFDPNGEYKPEEYLENQVKAETCATA